MSSFRTHILLAVAVGMPLATGGCAVAIVGGLAGAGAAGYAANQERGVAGTAEDFATKTNIEVAWMKADPALQSEATVTVYEGRTLLTGIVRNPAQKAEAERLARQVAGVRALYNEIEVAPDASTWDVASDTWITTQLRSHLVADAKIRSINYTIEAVHGAVYLIGSARTQDELDRATGWARNIPGVRRVVSFVEVRPGAPAMAQQPAALAPRPAEPQQAPANPPVPVEVHRL